MISLNDILSGKTHTNAILIYGAADTLTCGRDGITRYFNKYIHDLLMEKGFQNVVYFEASNSNGKFVLDDESAYYSFEQNQIPYFNKYHRTPDGKPIDSTPCEPQTVSFGHKRTPEATPEASPAESQTIRWQERQMQTESFYSEIRAFMTNTNVRSAVIFTNFSDVLQNSERSFVRRISDQVNSTFEIVDNASDNLMIFLAPDIHNTESMDLLLNQLTCSSLRDKFLIHTKKSWTFDPERCFAFTNTPGVDELKNLLTRYIIAGRNGKRLLPKGKSVGELADELNYLLREGFEQMTAANIPVRHAGIMQVKTALENYMDEFDGKTVPLTASDLVRLTPFDIKTEQNPEEKLRTTKGWENIYTKIMNEINEFNKLNPNFAVAANQSEQLSSSIMISRLMPRQSNYPSTKDLPHIILTGPSGVGKTTAAQLIGKILHNHGLLETGFIKVAKPNDLIAEHVGGTYTRTNATIDEAEGGVLMIDEAYTLYQDPKDTHANYRKECIECLVQALTDESRHFLLILSGYANSAPDACDGVEALFKMNSGLKRRIKCHLKMNPYSAELLSEITIGRLESYGYSLGKSVNEAGLIKYWEQRIRTSNRRDFANAREAVILSKELIGRAAKRSDENLIEAEDFDEDVRGLLLGEDCDYEDLLRQVEEDYPGLGSTVRKIAEKAIASIRSTKIRNAKRKRKNKKQEPLKSMVFVGNPGTGKTTIAKLLARILGAVGITSGSDPVVVSDPAHISAAEFKEKMNAACDCNTLFFVDEAYDLPESLATAMLPAMSDNPEFIAVFAVYPKEYDNFLKKNDGLASRLTRYQIPDYEPKAMIDIFRKMCEAEAYTFTDELIDDLGLLFKRWYDTRSTNDFYANARDIENLIGKMTESCDKRYFDSEDEDYRLTAEDIPKKEKDMIENMKQNSNIETILAELNTYVGLQNLRDIIISIYNNITADKEYYHLNNNDSLGHFIFVGNPGTGKTTGARIFARALYSLGILKSDKLTEISAADLIAGFLGQTAEKAKSVLTKGKYGVIFIDEAYMLNPKTDCWEDSYRKEAITQLLLFLEEENNTGDTVVILAGYENEMEAMLKNSEGLSSRIMNPTVKFPDYTEEECLDIVKRFLLNGSVPFTLTAEAEEKVRERIHLMKESADFSNARSMRTIASKLVSSAKSRLVARLKANGGSTEGVTEEEKYSIFPEDVF